MVVPSNLSLIDKSHLDLVIYPSLKYGTDRDLSFDWEIEDFTPYNLNLLLLFDKPEAVTFYSEAD